MSSLFTRRVAPLCINIFRKPFIRLQLRKSAFSPPFNHHLPTTRNFSSEPTPFHSPPQQHTQLNQITDALFTKGCNCLDADEALKIFETLLTLDPKHKLALLEIGNVHLYNHNLEESFLWVEKALAIEPLFKEGLIAKNTLLIMLGRHDEATDLTNLIIKNYPSCVRAYYFKGTSFKLRKMYKEALEMYEIGCALTEARTGELYFQHKQCFAFKASMLFELNKLDECLEWCNKVVGSRYESMFIWILKGDCENLKDMFTESTTSYTNALATMEESQKEENEGFIKERLSYSVQSKRIPLAGGLDET